MLKFVIFCNLFREFAKKFYNIRKSIKCGIKCKKFHKEILIREKVIQLLVHLILMVFGPDLLQMAERKKMAR